MLVEMTPEQVSENWGFYRKAIGKSLAPTITNTTQGMSLVLKHIMLGDLKVFMYDNEGHANFILSTVVREDPITEQRSLLIYSLTAFFQIKPNAWENAFDTLSKEAKRLGCSSVIAYSANEKIVNYMQSKGAKTSFTLIEMEVL